MKEKHYKVGDVALQEIINNESADGLLVHLKSQLRAQKCSDGSDPKKYTAILSYVLEDKFGMTQEEIDEWMRNNR